MIPTKEIIDNTGLFWQYPVITEQEFFNQNKNNSNYFGFPWATCIDKRIDLSAIYKLLLPYKEDKNYFTCCQHISFRKLIPLFKILNIKKVYTPHKIKNENQIHGVVLLPCPLYAVNIEDNNRNNEFRNVNYESLDRQYLFSFMGGVQSGYLTQIREDIFNLPKHETSIIINTGDWHFNTTVYSRMQNVNRDLNIDKKHIDKTSRYNEILLNSKYSLCPSGSGPNSIRFWESLACGCIPVLLSDTLELPYNIDWENAIVIMKEKDIHNIHNVLSNIDSVKESEMRKNCLNIYKMLHKNFRNLHINNYNSQKPTLFTSYLCDIEDEIVQSILLEWKKINPNMNILYFSDKDVYKFFEETEHIDLVKKMKNGVAIADFFRICYINKYGGYWFDIDIHPFEVSIPKNGNVHLYDCGFGNISYMFIGGKPNQSLFVDVIDNVVDNIKKNINHKTQHVMDITGPRIIQNIIFKELGLKNRDGILNAGSSQIMLQGHRYEFVYTRNYITSTKTEKYKLLQNKYNKKNYQVYNYI
jgi:mannosyltransferase OCH1-like enzyme